MNKLSRLVLGVACVSMLAGCAKSVTAEEAVKIANENWSIEKANAAGYTKVHVVNKYSDSSKNEEHDASGAAMSLVITALVPINLVAVNAAAAIEGVSFKADGTALEFSYSDKDGKYDYKINGVGLTTYVKSVAGNDWSETSYTWYK